MTSRLARALTAVLVAGSIAGTAVAYAHPSAFNRRVRAALRDCSTNDPLKGHYSLRVLQTALKDVKAEALQYTGCADVLIAAIRADSLGNPKKSHLSVNPQKNQKVTKPAQQPVVDNGQKAIKVRVQEIHSEGGAPVTLPSGETVTPGVVTVHSASFLSTLPTPLLIALAALLAAVVAVAGRALHNVVRARRSR